MNLALNRRYHSQVRLGCDQGLNSNMNVDGGQNQFQGEQLFPLTN